MKRLLLILSIFLFIKMEAKDGITFDNDLLTIDISFYFKKSFDKHYKNLTRHKLVTYCNNCGINTNCRCAYKKTINIDAALIMLKSKDIEGFYFINKEFNKDNWNLSLKIFKEYLEEIDKASQFFLNIQEDKYEHQELIKESQAKKELLSLAIKTILTHS